ncbi:MAG: DNA topoisomerase I [Candidatus Aenigmarchaeota archaeon]|nr:DNA topoisomerase I [Candidatus Aenigmarchaeota archaeon]
MSYTLILAEKPSAAQKIAYALSETEPKKIGKSVPSFKIQRGGKEMVVAPAVGHLFILDTKEKGKWTYPVFDIEWKTTYNQKGSFWAKKYFTNIQKLAKDADSFISATDYDTEGSVIAFNVLRFICGVKDGKRMKFSTLTKPDLVKAFENASDHLDFGQTEAGLTRHYLDFYWGINLTRAMTNALKDAGGFHIVSSGRVQSPTLKILVDRQKEIEKFVPVPYWEILLHGLVNAKKIEALYEKKKLWDKDEAHNIFEKCKGKNGKVVKVEKKEYKQNPPVPFDLTTLQRDAYNNFKFSPKQTLDIAQGLYLLALISYPRTSSQKLPASIGLKKILQNLGKQKDYKELSEKLLSKPKLWPNEGKRTDPAHPSVFPTGNIPKTLNPYQKKLYDLIVKRFLSVFADPALRETNTVKIDVNSEIFVANGVRTIQANWMEFYQPYTFFKEKILPEINEGDMVLVEKLDMVDKETQPPGRYSQASVLKEMEKLNLGTKCLTGDCKLISPDWKETNINSIWKKSEYICHDGDAEIRKINAQPIISFNQYSDNIEFTEPKLISRRKLKKKEKILKITTCGGEIKVTDDHFIYTYNEKIKKITLKRANEILENDKVINIITKNKKGKILLNKDFFERNKFRIYKNMYMSRFSQKNTLGILNGKIPIRWSSDLAWVLGYFYGDGSYNDPQYNGSHQLYFTAAEKSVKILKMRIKRIFGVEPKAYLVGKDKNKYKVQCNSAMATVIIKIFPLINGKKRLFIPKRFIGDFLRGFFDADGNVHLRSIGKVKILGNEAIGHGVPRIKMTLSKKDHIKWIKDLFLQIGIKTNISKGKAKLNDKYFECFTILIGGRDKVDKFAYKVGFDMKHKKETLYKGLLSDSLQYRTLKVCYDIVLFLKGKTLDIYQIKNNFEKYTNHDIKKALKYLVKISVLRRKRFSPHSNTPNRAVYSLIDKDYFIHALKASCVHIDSELHFSNIKKIEDIKSINQFVYDISVSKNSPNFITNGGILVHNSTRAQILQTLYERGYIKDTAITVTDLGKSVISALEKNSPEIISVEMTEKFEKEMEDIRNGKRKKEEVLEEAKGALEKILSEFKQKEKNIGEELMVGLKEVLKRQSTMGKCKCGGNLVIKYSKAGKRFVACDTYPKCTETFSLPHKGKLDVLETKCKTCGLHIVSVKNMGKRPWKLCIKCGFVNFKKRK